MTKVAVMQPYFMPYIGYFQMIKAVDYFVFYDDVNYIKGGWINRNRIKANNEAKYFTVPLISSSPNRLIKDIEVKTNSKEYANLKKTVIQNYAKAPYFEAVMPLIDRILVDESNTIAALAMQSIVVFSAYLHLQTTFKIASVDFSTTKGEERTQRLFSICSELNATTYINAIGGIELYDKDQFLTQDIQLQFIQSKGIVYNQNATTFIPWLSMLDVLMYNSVEEVNVMLDQYELI